MPEKTGRKRYRTKRTLFGTYVVLQLEWRCTGWAHLRGERTEWHEWHDARPEDITEFA